MVSPHLVSLACELETPTDTQKKEKKDFCKARCTQAHLTAKKFTKRQLMLGKKKMLFGVPLK